MRDLKEKIKLKKVDFEKLLVYGFKKINCEYIYKKNIVNSLFYVEVIYKNNRLISRVIEVDCNLEYIMVDVKYSGEFTSKVRREYEAIIDDVINSCFDNDIFKNKKTKNVIKYIKDKYNTELEYLWPDTPNYAVMRNKNNKWYGIIMSVSKDKIGIDGDGIIDIINVKHPSDRIIKLIDNRSFFQAYHMNKKNWITILLDNKIEDKVLFKLIDTSYILTFD